MTKRANGPSAGDWLVGSIEGNGHVRRRFMLADCQIAFSPWYRGAVDELTIKD